MHKIQILKIFSLRIYTHTHIHTYIHHTYKDINSLLPVPSKLSKLMSSTVVNPHTARSLTSWPCHTFIYDYIHTYIPNNTCTYIKAVYLGWWQEYAGSRVRWFEGVADENGDLRIDGRRHPETFIHSYIHYIHTYIQTYMYLYCRLYKHTCIHISLLKYA